MDRMDFDTMNEAFRAGNRARKKESAADTVESVDNIQAQIDLFKKQTGIELEIRDGRPYYNGYLHLENYTELTDLPADLKVNGDLCLNNCTGLTGLPADLEVNGYLNLIDCTGLTSLPAGLKVNKNLDLTGCTGLTGLPFDLVVQGVWIEHTGVLTPFFKKLGIPVDKEGDTKASDWRMWQKAHGYLKEAFRAGNRARKKESVSDAAADMHNPLQDQIDRFREQTGIKLEIKDGRPYYKGNCMDFSGNADIPDNTFVEGDFSVSIEQEKLPAGLTVTGMLNLEDCKKLTELSPDITACDLKLTHSGIKKVPKDTNITGSFIIYGPHDQDLDRFFREDCGLQPLTVNAGSDYRPDFENRIIGFSWNRWRTVGKPDFDKIHNMLTANEAFRAGNRVRKKESVQDTVESVDNMQAQIDLFKKQSGIELEIRDGHPYFDKDLDLDGCTGLTDLPDNLEINGYLSLMDCTGLTRLSTGLKVGKSLYLNGCTGLTDLPAGLEIGGSLQLDDCTGLTGLPAGLKVGRDLSLTGCTGLTSLPAGLEVGKSLVLKGCTGLTSLPFDLVVCGNWIEHKGILTPFFRKLGIPVDDEGDTKAEDWHKWQKAHGYHKETFRTGNRARKWQKAHGYLKEAFRAGNTARKKESVQDTVESVDSLEEQVREFEKVTGAKLEIKQGRPFGTWLNLKDCTELTRLPDGLIVHGNLNLAGCTGLKKLPDGLTVYGYLNLHRCTGLTSLPHGMYITGSLRLSECDGITELPADLKIEIKDIQSNSIYNVPDSLKPFLNRLGIKIDKHGQVAAEDWMERRHLIGKTDEAFRAGNRARKKESAQDAVETVDTIQAQIDLFKKQTDMELEIRDGHPYFNGYLYLSDDTEGLTGLPDRLEVEEGLNLEGWTELTSLPAGLKVNGELNLSGCTGLTSLPGDLEVGGDLNLEYCTGLTSLPAGLKVGEGLNLEYCTGLTSLPDDLKVRERLNLEYCTGLTSLPDGLEVGGDLDLYDCTGLTSLPDGLKVGRNLDLTGCTGLTDLPAGLTVQGELSLARCTGLTSLPDGLKVGRDLWVADSLTSLPFDLVVNPDYLIIHHGALTPFFNKLGIPCYNNNRQTKASDWREWQKAHGYLKEAFKAGNRARKKESVSDTVSVGLTPEQQVKLFMADVMKYREWLIQQGNDVRYDTVNPGKDNEVPVGVYYEDGIDDVFRIEPDGTVVIRSIVDFTDYPYEIHFPEKVQCNALVNLINCDGLTHLPDNMYVEDHLNLERCKNLRRLPEDLYVGFDLYLNGCTGLESLPSNFTVNYGDLDLEDCPNIKEIPTGANLVRGRIVFSPDSELHRFFIRNDIGYTTEGTNNPANPRKWHICDFSKWNAWKNGMREAFRAGNRARKKESAADTVESVGDKHPVAIDGPAELIKRLAVFLDGLGYEKTIDIKEPYKQLNGSLKYYVSINEGNPHNGGNIIRISLGRHPMWDETWRRFHDTGLTLEIEATADRMYYRIKPDVTDLTEVQFLNCSSEWFDAWEKPDGTRYGKPRNREALTDNSIPAVWPNMFGNIAEAACDPNLEFVPDLVYTRCYKFKEAGAVREAFRAGNRARKQETARDTVQTAGEYRPVTRELFKDVIDSVIDPEEGPISGRIYRRYDRSITGQCIADCLDRILELCGYKDMLKAEVAFTDDTCDGVQITDDKNYSVSRLIVQYNRDYVCVLTGSMDTGMPGLLYAYRNLPGILEVHLEGIDSLNADLREYIEKFG